MIESDQRAEQGELPVQAARNGSPSAWAALWQRFRMPVFVYDVAMTPLLAPLFDYRVVPGRGGVWRNSNAVTRLTKLKVTGGGSHPSLGSWRAGELADLEAALLMPAVARGAISVSARQAAVDQARIACALERYRLREQQLPETIQALAPALTARPREARPLVRMGWKE